MSYSPVGTNGSDPVSKGKMKMTTCLECSWTVKSPWGENDVIDHMMLYAKNHHPEMLKHSKEDMKKMIKDPYRSRAHALVTLGSQLGVR